MSKEIFRNYPSKVEDIMKDVISGRLGLPDLQRPFVWSDNKVRDLLDSMMKGFPIGYIMIWDAPDDYDNAKSIGDTTKVISKPKDLVIDGQQRITSLLSAIYGIKIIDVKYRKRPIRISFNPVSRAFEVWTAATEKDQNWISDISTAFKADEEHCLSKFRRQVYSDIDSSRVKKGLEPLTEEEKDAIENNIKDLLDLKKYTIPVMEILSDAQEDDVSEIFKRVNSGGQKLNEQNFIETLLAVYDNEVHAKINDFCRDSHKPAPGTSYNHVIVVTPAHLIRVAVGLGFHRARLRYAYMIMRGKDLQTGHTSPETRKVNLAQFKAALNVATDLNNWHAYINLCKSTGYLNGGMVSSNNAIIYGYMFYLIGRFQYHVTAMPLEKICKKWLFTSMLTGYYTQSSPETTTEHQFADLRSVTTPQGYIDYFEKEIQGLLTDDFFNITLVNSLNSSAAISPEWNAYTASLNILSTPMLFSTTYLVSILTPGSDGRKKSLDKHHIFPKHHLEKMGITDDRVRNQIANFTYLDYQTNIFISDRAPELYVDEFRTKLGEEGYKKTCAENALPENFKNMPYDQFLSERRKLMAGIIKKAYLKLCE